MTSKTIIASIENILPLFGANIKHGLNQTNRTIFTNKYTQTLYQHKNQIQQIKRLRNSTFVQNYGSTLAELGKDKKDGVILLVGNPHQQLFDKIKELKVITLQEMCDLYPEKVPISCRSRDTKQTRERIEKRIQMSLQRQPHIEHILLTNHCIQMWDQAIQVILDHQPTSIIVQYEQFLQLHPLYKLKMNDFLAALKTCFKIVHKKELTNLIDLNTENRNINWLIQQAKKENPKSYIVVDEDLVNDRQKLVQKLIQVERVDENSHLWF